MSDETIPRTTVVDTVTERLRRELLTGVIPPGGRIRVGELEQRFGVSHIPIREALRRLESEGLVVTSPQRATVAAGLTLEDLAGLYDLRRLIEVPVSRRAVEQATDADVQAVVDALATLEDTAAEPESFAFWESHRAFHTALLAPGTTALIRRTLDQLWQTSERYVRLTVTTFGTMEGAMQDHRAMTKAFSERRADDVAQLLVQHLTRTEEALTRGYLATQERETA